MFLVSEIDSISQLNASSERGAEEVSVIGRTLIIVGIILAGIGVLFMLADKIPYVGRLPGDLYIKKDRFSFYFPITTSIIISIILTIIFSLFRK